MRAVGVSSMNDVLQRKPEGCRLAWQGRVLPRPWARSPNSAAVRLVVNSVARPAGEAVQAEPTGGGERHGERRVGSIDVLWLSSKRDGCDRRASSASTIARPREGPR